MNAHNAEDDAPVEVRTQEDLNALWFHLTNDHGLSLSSLHGDPFLMHAAATAHRLCTVTYVDACAIPPASGREASDERPYPEPPRGPVDSGL